MTLSGAVLITGGSGSLGTAILRRAQQEGWPAKFTVYSRDEVKQSVVAERFPGVRCVLGDVRDAAALTRAMRGIETVIHAAAYKRVPEAERETVACAEANVEGSIRVASAALSAGVARVTGISTDKACYPINAYGQSKALMERLFQAFARYPEGPAFHLVRYGNVLASRGSVVPTLRAQVQRGEPVTITDPLMTRFWLTLDDAVDLVLCSLEAEPGEVVVPRVRSATMGVLAEAVAPGHPIRIVGGRGGEKQHEALLNVIEAPFARPYGPGWALRSLALAPRDELPDGFQYTSDRAPRLSVEELRDAIGQMDAGAPARLLA